MIYEEFLWTDTANNIVADHMLRQMYKTREKQKETDVWAKHFYTMNLN